MLHMTVFLTEYLGTIGVRGDIFDKDDVGASHWLGCTPETFYDPSDYLEDPMRAMFVALNKWANVHIPPASLSLASREKAENDEMAGGGVAQANNSAAAKRSPSKG